MKPRIQRCHGYWLCWTDNPHKGGLGLTPLQAYCYWLRSPVYNYVPTRP